MYYISKSNLKYIFMKRLLYFLVSFLFLIFFVFLKDINIKNGGFGTSYIPLIVVSGMLAYFNFIYLFLDQLMKYQIRKEEKAQLNK